MKVAYVSNSDSRGGAARGAMRLVAGFREFGVECDFIVQKKHDPNSVAIQYDIPLSAAKRRFNEHLTKTVYPTLRRKGQGYQSFNLRYTGLDDFLNGRDYDIILLHWIGDDTLSIKELPKLKAPVVWRLADEWAVSGSQHYSKHGTGMVDVDTNGCKLMENPNGFLWRRKARHWSSYPVHYVAGSRWLTSLVGEQKFCSDSTERVIPSALDTEKFQPKPVTDLRIGSWQYDPSIKYILYGAANATKDRRKGFDLLCDAIKKWNSINSGSDLSRFQLIVFGNRDTPVLDLPIEVNYVGEVNNSDTLVELFNISTVTVVPSRIDNLPYVAMESLACGTPVVAFEVGGLGDLVDAEALGELVPAFDTSALSRAIHQQLTRNTDELIIKEICRSKALQEYSLSVQVARYRELFSELMSAA